MNRPEFHLFDRDASAAAPPKHQAKINAVNQRSGCKAVSTSRLELENFVHHRAMNACAQTMGLALNLGVPFGPDDDVPKRLAVELNQLSPPSAKWGESRVKAWLAEYVVPAMDVPMIVEIDPAGEMLGWMNDIGTMLAPPGAPMNA